MGMRSGEQDTKCRRRAVRRFSGLKAYVVFAPNANKREEFG